MPLFTSNSDAAKISRIALLTLFILGLYEVLIWAHIVPPSQGSSQNEENTIGIEHFMYDGGERKPVVLIGSSLTSNLKDFVLPGQSVNLGLAGGSLMTGLEILAHSADRPKLVLLEANYPMTRPVDSDQLGATTNIVMTRVRSAFPIFRKEYQPVGVFVTFLKNRAKHGGAKEGLQLDNVTHTELVELAVKSYARSLSAQEINNYQLAAAKVAQDIGILRSHGTRVILLRIPMEAATDDSPRIKQIDALLAQAFPIARYEWLRPPPAVTWHTTDGDHLTRADCRIYASFVNNSLAQYAR